MSLLRAFTVFLGAIWLIMSAAAPVGARDIINAPFNPISIDILEVTERIQSASPEAEVEAAPDSSGTISTMRLSAISKGPQYRWLVFSIRNSSPIPLEYVIVAQHRSFVGSGVIWPIFGTRMLVDAQASPGLPPTQESTRTADGYSFRIESNQTITYALEVSGDWPDNLSIWQRDAFEQQRQQVSFFHGLLLGIATLVSIYVSSLFIIRRKMVFPSAALFSWCSTIFLAVEFGYLPVIIDVPFALEYKIRAIVEALMALSVFGCLYTFVELRKRIPVMGYLMLLVILGAIALVGYAYVEPAIGSGLARISILLGALVGMAIVLILARRGVIRAQVALSAWLLISIWSILAAIGATGILEHDLVGPGLAAGLVLVNLMMAFTVTQYAFDAGVISSRFFEDSGRRALALAGSEQCVWDWREDQGWLYVGPELEPTLGVKRGTLSTAGLKGWLELMHPGDRPAYVAAVEAAIQRGKGTFAQEFRLRRKDGTYRWYQLRARAIPGEQGRASRCIGTLADITTMKRSEERMLYDAVQDRLTGLPNRALFMDRLDRALRRAQSDESVRLFVAVVDIDRFKNVNDGLGHSIGDSLLLTMARRLQQFIGPEDTLARLSGDQFGLIINAARPERKMHELTEQMRQAVARPVELNPREVFLTASVGVTEYLRDILQAADILKDAEIALYEAKRRGKNKIEFFRPTMRDERSKLIEIETDLRRALERNEIEVAYQPIYNLEIEKLAGFEALVRWRHKKHGLLGPDEFIGIAEETGIIIDLGRYVLGEAARQLGIWQRVLRPSDPIFVSVNLSPRQVLDQNLVDDVKAIMSREDINRGSLKLELTESMVMENVELSAQVLRKLTDVGVAILCDDFGTGHSSLSNLQRFSFDTLKIDKSFIDADPEDDAAMVILESIIILAHDLDMRVVAEGVESKDQLERLRHFECDYAQGFYFGEPLTARAVVEALGGKPHMLEQKRSRSPRGFLGKLMRSGTFPAEDDPATMRSKLKTDPPESSLTMRPRPFEPPPAARPAGAEERPAFHPEPEVDSEPRTADRPEAPRHDNEPEQPAADAAEQEAAESAQPTRPLPQMPPSMPARDEPPAPKRSWFFKPREEPLQEQRSVSDKPPAPPPPPVREPEVPMQEAAAHEPPEQEAERPADEPVSETPAEPAQDKGRLEPEAAGAAETGVSEPEQSPAEVEKADNGAATDTGAEAADAPEEPVQVKADATAEAKADAKTGSSAEPKSDGEGDPQMTGDEVAATASALASARSGAGPARNEPADSPSATQAAETQETEEPDAPAASETDRPSADAETPEKQLESLAAGERKKSSKLARLLRRGRKSPTPADQ